MAEVTANPTDDLTEDDVLEMMKDCKAEHGVCKPRVFESNEEYCSVEAVEELFGSWCNAVKRIGL